METRLIARDSRNLYLWALLGVVLSLAGGVVVNYLALSLVISRDVRLDGVIGRIVYLDEVLTMSARMAAATGEERWNERYIVAERELAEAISEARAFADGRGEGILRTSAANDRLVKIERRVFDLVAAGDTEGAKALMFDEEYASLKEEYSSGVDALQRALAGRLERRIDFAGWILLGSGVVAVIGLTAVAWALHVSVQRRREQARVSEELVQLARRGTMGELAAGLAHELSQPLAAAGNYGAAGLALLERQGSGSERLRETLEGVVSQLDRAGQIISQMRSFAKGDAGNLLVHDLGEVVLSSIDLVRAEAGDRGVSVTMEWDGQALPVRVDRVRLQQVVVNLLVNGVDAAAGRRGAVLARCSREEAVATFVVCDSGPGVEASLRGRMFEPFFTTKQDGLGLGLSLSRDLVEGMGGRLAYRDGVCPSIGTGSGFVVSFPIAEEGS